MAAPSDVGSDPFEPWPADAEVHVEWGAVGARLAADRGDLVVVVDVLSFSTSVTLAVGHGATALSYSTAEIEAAGGRDALCAAVRAEIVAKDRAASDARFSLSPTSLATIAPGDRLIFTSLNGAACTSAAGASPRVLIGGLSNRAAVASLVAEFLAEGLARRCTIIAAAEHWSSSAGSERGIRPGVEDWLGAGAIARVLANRNLSLSLEARLAAAAFDVVAADPRAALESCISGRELIAKGFGDDVELAAEIDSIDVVPAWDTGLAVREFSAARST